MSQDDSVEVAEFCGSCGVPRSKDAQFCVACGAPMTGPPPASEASTAAPAALDGTAIVDGKVAGIALAAGALAVLLWFVLGATSLLFDLVLAGYVLVVALSGQVRPDAETVLASIRKVDVMRRGADAVGRLGPVMALAALPLAAGLVSVAASGLHHSSPSDVCEAYVAFVEESNKPVEIGQVGDDSEWFTTLAELGKVAEDFKGSSALETESTRTAGQNVSAVAKGRGNGIVVSADPAEANRAAAPLSAYCTEGD